MLLNLGSGPWYADGWVNVDSVAPDEKRAPDVLGSVLDMPFAAGTFERVYCGHLLEHIPWDLIPRLWDEVRRVCVSGAEVMAVGPCIHRAISTGQPTSIIRAILADPRHAEGGLGHAWTPTEEFTAAAVALGLERVRAVSIASVVKPEWPNPTTAPWQCAVQGRVP